MTTIYTVHLIGFWFLIFIICFAQYKTINWYDNIIYSPCVYIRHTIYHTVHYGKIMFISYRGDRKFYVNRYAIKCLLSPIFHQFIHLFRQINKITVHIDSLIWDFEQCVCTQPYKWIISKIASFISIFVWAQMVFIMFGVISVAFHPFQTFISIFLNRNSNWQHHSPKISIVIY